MGDEYRGRATLLAASGEIEVEVHLGGHVDPVDGRFHWRGRIVADETVSTLFEAGERAVDVRTPSGQAPGRLTERNPWGGMRIVGVGPPPFLIDST